MKKIYNLINEFPKKIKNSYEIEVPVIKKFNRVVVVGMGANYVVGILLKEFLRDEISVEVLTREIVFDKKTLIIFLSYSGNTKEVLKVFNNLKNKKNVLVLTSGGKLLKVAKKFKVELVRISSELHPRFTFAECFFPILKCLSKSRLIKNKDKLVYRIIRSLIKNKENIEKETNKLSFKLRDKYPLFYATNYFYPVAYRLQTAIEEDVKIICHSNNITELFHNELEAIPDKRFFPILILDKNEIRGFEKQIDFFKKHIKKFYEIGFGDYSREERVFLIFYFADFLSYYLSKLKNTKIGETPLSDKIKRL